LAGIIGFFVGVMVSTYLTFLTSTGGFVGKVIGWISLQPLTSLFGTTDNVFYTISFFFFIAVYVVYGALLGLFIRSTGTSATISILLVILIGIGGYEQITHIGESLEIVNSQPAAVAMAIQKTPQKYFGIEATGDLNADGRKDVAFILRRDDLTPAAYYLAASLGSTAGHDGTNMLFLGERAKPDDISITDGVISVQYVIGSSTKSHTFKASIDNGTLKKLSI
jgi:hypothetical protein